MHGAGADRRLSPAESHDLAGALWRRKGRRGGGGDGTPGESRLGRKGEEERGEDHAHGESLLYQSPSGNRFVYICMLTHIFQKMHECM